MKFCSGGEKIRNASGHLGKKIDSGEIIRANASLGELRRDEEKLSFPMSCEFVRVKAS